MNNNRYTLIVGITGMLAFCPQADATKANPPWIDNPPSTQGLIEATCVKSSADFTISRSKATAKARANLARQIETKVDTIEKQLISDDKQSYVNISELSASEFLHGSKLIKSSTALFDNAKYYCVLMEISPANLHQAFERMVSNRQISANGADNKALYRMFIHSQTQSKLTQKQN